MLCCGLLVWCFFLRGDAFIGTCSFLNIVAVGGEGVDMRVLYCEPACCYGVDGWCPAIARVLLPLIRRASGMGWQGSRGLSTFTVRLSLFLYQTSNIAPST